MAPVADSSGLTMKKYFVCMFYNNWAGLRATSKTPMESRVHKAKALFLLLFNVIYSMLQLHMTHFINDGVGVTVKFKNGEAAMFWGDAFKFYRLNLSRIGGFSIFCALYTYLVASNFIMYKFISSVRFLDWLKQSNFKVFVWKVALTYQHTALVC